MKRTVKSFRRSVAYPPMARARFRASHQPGRSAERRVLAQANRTRKAAASVRLPLGLSFALGKLEQLGSRYGIEVRHPLDDRRMVEFANAIPDEQRRNGIWQRYVMRQAMSDLLPAAIHQRMDKATFDWSFSAAIQPDEFGRILSSPRIAAAGWIDAGKLRSEWEAFGAGHRRYMVRLFTTGCGRVVVSGNVRKRQIAERGRQGMRLMQVTKTIYALRLRWRLDVDATSK